MSFAGWPCVLLVEHFIILAVSEGTYRRGILVDCVADAHIGPHLGSLRIPKYCVGPYDVLYICRNLSAAHLVPIKLVPPTRRHLPLVWESFAGFVGEGCYVLSVRLCWRTLAQLLGLVLS